MSAQLVTIFNDVAGLLIGLSMLVVVYLLGRGPRTTTAPTALRFGWFLVALLGIAVVVLRAISLAQVV